MHLIGIELVDCKNNIFKNLKKKGHVLSTGEVFNGWYPFCGYEENKNPPSSENIDITYQIPQNFYKSRNNDKFVSVSCIVGKNGSGKSSLLDIFYRIINNISYILLDLDPFVVPKTLTYTYGFSANLYFSTIERTKISENNPSEKLGYIKINNNGHDYIKFPNEQERCICEVDDENEKIVIDENFNFSSVNKLKDLFYSVVTNYSMYSFNPEDYEKDHYYVYDIFHKNDAYITPIVLLPFRNGNGEIDVENERGLARQRIIALQAYLSNHYDEPISLIPDRKICNVTYIFKADYIKTKKKNIANLVNKFLVAVKKTGLPTRKEDTIVFFEKLKTLWIKKISEKYNIDIFKQFKSTKIREALIFYLSYKTLKTCEYYKLFINNFNCERMDESLNVIIDNLCNNNTFITLKIRQCLNFIINPLPLKKIIGENVLPIKNIKTGKERCKENVDDYVLRLPPAIFYTDLQFESDTNTPFYMSSLSSGELQLINSYSYVLYHLKNLECDKSAMTGSGNVDYPNYSNIEIIFDEAELYMHPEYQRQFIYSMINAINSCNFQNIQQIHLLIATHSPYMLSDVPVQNILMLEDGEIRRANVDTNQTFGSNIYDLLKTQFFMTSAIGEYAKQTINKLSFPTEVSDEELEILLKRVDFIGDSYLRNSINYIIRKRKVQKEKK